MFVDHREFFLMLHGLLPPQFLHQAAQESSWSVLRVSDLEGEECIKYPARLGTASEKLELVAKQR